MSKELIQASKNFVARMKGGLTDEQYGRIFTLCNAACEEALLEDEEIELFNELSGLDYDLDGFEDEDEDDDGDEL